MGKSLAKLFSIDIRSLELFRIGLALITLFDLFHRSQYLYAHYTDYGILPRAAVQQYLSWWVFSPYFISGEGAWIILLFAVHAIFAICLLAGIKPKLSVSICWFLTVSLEARNPLITSGGDALLRMLLFWAMFVPLKNYSQKPYQALSLGSAALLLQMGFMYLFTIFLKDISAWFYVGDVIEKTLSNDFYVKALGKDFLQFCSPEFLQLLTKSTFLFEFIGVLLAFSPFSTTRIRNSIAALFILMHISHYLLLDIGIFPWVAVVGWIPFIRTSSQTKVVQKNQSSIVSAFLVFIFVSNIFSIYRFRSFTPEIIKTLEFITRTTQRWEMFAPAAPSEDGWIYIELQDASGHVKVYNPLLLAQTNKKPELVIETFKYYRWRKYFLNITENQKLIELFLSYACSQMREANVLRLIFVNESHQGRTTTQRILGDKTCR